MWSVSSLSDLCVSGRGGGGGAQEMVLAATHRALFPLPQMSGCE